MVKLWKKKKKRREKKEGKRNREKAKKEKKYEEKRKGEDGYTYVECREQVNCETFQQEHFEKKRVKLNRKRTPKIFVSGPKISRGPKSWRTLKKYLKYYKSINKVN